MVRNIARTLLAIGGLAGAGEAAAQSYTVTIDRNVDMGTIVAGSTGQTVFRASPSGAVSRISGTGTRTTTASTLPAMATVSCTGNTSSCRDTVIQVTIASTGTPTNRAGALDNFTILAGTAVIVTPPSGTNPASFTMSGVPTKETRTFYIGFDMPILGDDSAGATGLSRSLYSVVAGATGGTAGTVSGAAEATVVRNLTMTSLANMSFGRMLLPTSGTQSVTLAPNTATVTLSGSGSGGRVWSIPAPTAATFRITGEGGRAFSLSIPASFTLNGPGNAAPITVTTISTASGAQTLSGAPGAAGTFDLKLGGSFSISSSTRVGTYSGTVSVTAQYN